MSYTPARTALLVGIACVLAAPAAVASSLSSPAAQPAASTYTPAEAALLAAEDALFAADVRHDVTAIARGFADEAVFVHASGMVQTKADYLKAAASPPRFPTSSVTGTDRVVRIFGDIGVVRGTKTVVAGQLHLAGTYLSVYVKRDGRWQMLDQQSSPAPRAPGSPPMPGGPRAPADSPQPSAVAPSQ